ISTGTAWAKRRCWIYTPMRACVRRRRLEPIMIKATFGLTKEPFYRSDVALLPQQAEAMEMIKIHAQHGGFSVIVGNPGVGKSILREHLECLGKERETIVASFTQTMHTYQPIL